MDVHHIKRKADCDTDEYSNLIFVANIIHVLIHAAKDETINEYLEEVELDAEDLKKLNKYRKRVGNSEIEVTK